MQLDLLLKRFSENYVVCKRLKPYAWSGGRISSFLQISFYSCRNVPHNRKTSSISARGIISSPYFSGFSDTSRTEAAVSPFRTILQSRIGPAITIYTCPKTRASICERAKNIQSPGKRRGIIASLWEIVIISADGQKVSGNKSTWSGSDREPSFSKFNAVCSGNSLKPLGRGIRISGSLWPVISQVILNHGKHLAIRQAKSLLMLLFPFKIW